MDLFEIINRCTDTTIITGHSHPDFDCLASCFILKQLLYRFGVTAQIIFTEELDRDSLEGAKKYLPDAVYSVCAPENSSKIILCDAHNNPFGDKGEVIAVIDHHPTVQKSTCPLYENKTSSSAAKLVFDIGHASGITMSKSETAAALASIYFDTVSCKNSKFQACDIPWINENAPLCNICLPELERDALCLTSCDLSASELACSGYKEYSIDKYKIASSYIQASANDKIELVLKECERLRKSNCLDLWLFIVYNPIEMTTREIYQGIMSKDYTVPGLLSRGNDIIPQLENELLMIFK